MATATLISLEDFEHLPDEPGKQELSEGDLIAVPPANFLHNELSKRLFIALHSYLAATAIGEARFEAGFQLGPRTVRQPDVAVTLGKRVARADGWLEGAPDIAIEVLSPANSAEDIHLKISQYLGAGAKAVWIVSPKAKHVSIYRGDGTWEQLREPQELSGEAILPGFVLPLADLFF